MSSKKVNLFTLKYSLSKKLNCFREKFVHLLLIGPEAETAEELLGLLEAEYTVLVVVKQLKQSIN